jgi:hypothetical protein
MKSTRSRRRLSWVAAASIGAAAVMFWQPLASLAKPGAVTTRDGQTYVGDVADTDAKFVITQDGGAKIDVLKPNVASTTYFENHQQEFDARMRQLAPKDVKGRIAVARWAIKQKEDGLAAQALDSALKIEPSNVEAGVLRKSLTPTPPTTAPDPANPPKTAAVKPRLVTKEEINRIRQVEWQSPEDPVRVNIDKETKAMFLARSRDVTPAQFNRMTPPEQARAILKNGTDEMREGVHLSSDPAPVANFRRNIQKQVLSGCAAAGCHDAATKTSFLLYSEPTPSDETTYTNYLILQTYKTLFPKDKAKGRVRLMIDRDQPGDSLLSEFMLQPRIANTPHPDVQGYTGTSRSVQDARFKMLTQWIHGMPAVVPDYGVDLSKPPEKDKPAAPAAPPAPAAPAAKQ